MTHTYKKTFLEDDFQNQFYSLFSTDNNYTILFCSTFIYISVWWKVFLAGGVSMSWWSSNLSVVLKKGGGLKCFSVFPIFLFVLFICFFNNSPQFLVYKINLFDIFWHLKKTPSIEILWNCKLCSFFWRWLLIFYIYTCKLSLTMKI